ncbi:hypothetical protein IBT50_20645 [Bacillus sp. S70]|uniref:hypothetical protein n=2 Tax=Bacillus TaxID=1386 RepID=UPI00190B8529|nr:MULTISPECIES: hypothetical protein [unclassified Bacillus (in: firmicutes)]MBJ9981106.1 hypothetical protein [Bacillus sp. S29]MBK0103766.1 hypothetical protein [Bacillus sp. S70]MBK0105826.1 hypothetical protein [Bacillus sp. S73]MBK0135684.1 hypothetical protein [Bacillus sp. S72]MBK0158602.1 hypothetical protein [Bacillus sp. S71]
MKKEASCGAFFCLSPVCKIPYVKLIKFLIFYGTNSIINSFEKEYYVLNIKFIRKGFDEKLPKPPKPPKPPGGGNTNNCNSLCNAIASNLKLASDLNAAGFNVSVHLEYDETPNNAITITVTSVNLQNCTIQGTREGTGENKMITCAFAFANYIDMQIN